MSSLGVGKEVLSFCGKCKLTLAHIIITMKAGDTINKVQCKTCNATHVYKDPSKVKAKKVSTRTRTVSKKANSQESISDLWLTAVGNAKTKSKDYSPKATFLKGDIVDHPKFGPGVIDKIIDGNKIEVIFRHSIKTLVHNM
ncbi:MAG: hypothetical protein COW01_09095 [Bdellovibrionales bacterium CG12_big_fil_rev_8_21_14_0_65_38_15]|nr:MAG: hypothetical protein COW79_09100 [Bdellovibrionales bacterium CG22_combo_CG10-13_8_21_14_all_38_13]PIQ54684.1 MAG: hypothetical protein COW01_09095 [Bdellovibrionales bacterium CG12_big_fil_rev_8_21_14_0_65_38_15]PIR30832.1 MAG: hypothetical protein COV38_03280 [Bdellovibrionales bacterium CG11_big_fil_rev_8_21_14_0_20_38_13]